MDERFFFRYELRTTEVEGSRAFYRDVLELDAWPAELEVSPLPEQARARGGRSHWLGHVGVEDPEAVAAEFVARGATRLGPARTYPEGGLSIALRDPFGVFVAISTPGTPARGSIVGWHHLNTPDREGSIALYAALLGWTTDAPVSLAWSARSITDEARVHPHWYFFFRVRDLDAALERVRARGGLTLPIDQGPGGARLAACDDPCGAAFGLIAA
jgi:predicted enzyme related to lactoylglutathione lyase